MWKEYNVVKVPSKYDIFFPFCTALLWNERVQRRFNQLWIWYRRGWWLIEWLYMLSLVSEQHPEECLGNTRRSRCLTRGSLANMTRALSFYQSQEASCGQREDKLRIFFMIKEQIDRFQQLWGASGQLKERKCIYSRSFGWYVRCVIHGEWSSPLLTCAVRAAATHGMSEFFQ